MYSCNRHMYSVIKGELILRRHLNNEGILILTMRPTFVYLDNIQNSLTVNGYDANLLDIKTASSSILISITSSVVDRKLISMLFVVNWLIAVIAITLQMSDNVLRYCLFKTLIFKKQQAWCVYIQTREGTCEKMILEILIVMHSTCSYPERLFCRQQQCWV